VDPDGQATGGGADPRQIPLAQLAKQAADGQDVVARVLSRILHESASSIKTMMFNSAI
jgi:hypothetical protein